MAYSSNDPSKRQKVINSQILGDGTNNAAQQAQDAMSMQQEQAAPLSPQAPAPVPVKSSNTRAAKAPSSGTFTNVQQFAQKNIPATQRMGQAIQQNVQSAADVAKKNIEQTQSRFSTEVERGSLQGRDTAAEEAKAKALQAAGGAQQQAEAKPIDYTEQTTNLQKQIADYNAKLKQQQQGQSEFQKFQKAQQDIQNLSKYIQDYARINQPRNQAGLSGWQERDALRKQGEELNKVFGNLDKFTQMHGRRGSYAMYTPGKSGFVDRIIKESNLAKDPIYADALKGYFSAAQQTANNVPGRYISQPLTDPKYFDRSAEIKDLQKRIGASQQDLGLYQEMAKFTPPQQLVPEILKQEAQFSGPVSDERFAEIINAVYGGPERLSQIKGFDEASARTKEADRRLALIDKAGVDRGLLQTVFRSPTRDYSAGATDLDQLLLSQSGAVQDMLSAKEEIGNVGDVLSQAQQASMAESATRRGEIEYIRQQARSGFMDIAKARQGQVDERLKNVMDNWDKLPQFYRDAITKSMAENKGAAKLSDIEAGILGVRSGEGLYNAIKDQGINNVIRAAQADKERLIGQKEFLNLEELQRLAGMADDYGTLGTDMGFKSGFQDFEKAGTQTAMDALDTQNLRNILASREQKFASDANKRVTGTGVGQDRYKSGFRSRTVEEVVKLNANLKDALKKAGYKFDNITTEDMARPEFASEIAKYLSSYDDASDERVIPKLDLTDPQSYLSAYGGAFTGDWLTGIPIGSAIGDTATRALNNLFGTLSKLPVVGSPLGGLFGSGKSNAQSTARRNAQLAAQADLQKNIQNELQKLGYFNRFAVDSNDPLARARRADFLKTIGSLDTTNTGELQTREQLTTPQEQMSVPDILALARRRGQSYIK